MFIDLRERRRERNINQFHMCLDRGSNPKHFRVSGDTAANWATRPGQDSFFKNPPVAVRRYLFEDVHHDIADF